MDYSSAPSFQQNVVYPTGEESQLNCLPQQVAVEAWLHVITGGKISTDTASTAVYVVPTNEEWVIAAEAATFA